MSKEVFPDSTIETIHKVNKCKFEKLNADVIENIYQYASINSLFDTCNELHKSKKIFLLIELNEKKSVKFLKNSEYRNYIYSLVDFPRKQIILNIIEEHSNFDREINFDFIFNRNDDFDSQYLDILKNVYLYKFNCLSLNRNIASDSYVPSVVFNKRYLNFISLGVDLLIDDFIVDNVNYDIEHILINKNIKIRSICQTPDLLDSNDSKQYNLYKKLKMYSEMYSEKYSINFEPIQNPDLIRIIADCEKKEYTLPIFNDIETMSTVFNICTPFYQNSSDNCIIESEDPNIQYTKNKKNEYCMEYVLKNIDNIANERKYKISK